jgi:hypothetical protein
VQLFIKSAWLRQRKTTITCFLLNVESRPEKQESMSVKKWGLFGEENLWRGRVKVEWGVSIIKILHALVSK